MGCNITKNRSTSSAHQMEIKINLPQKKQKKFHYGLIPKLSNISQSSLMQKRTERLFDKYRFIQRSDRSNSTLPLSI